MLDEVKQYIRSYVPGRLRLRHPGLKGIDADTEKLIVETVTSAAGITGCTINPEVGSLLLTWDRHALTEEDLLGCLSFWAAFIPGMPSGKRRRKLLRKTRTKRRTKRLNRVLPSQQRLPKGKPRVRNLRPL